MMAVPITLSPNLQLGAARKLFDWQKPPEGVSGRMFDVAPDGRFLVTASIDSSAQTSSSVSVVLNWLAGAQRQATGR